MRLNSIIKAIVIVITIAFVNTNIYSQDEVSNLKKYWFYRDRLKYFVYPGTERGESIVATKRNGSSEYIVGSDPWDYLQITENPLITMGYYIGTLATEYKLLSANHQNTERTLNELTLALQAIVRLDNCETLPRYGEPVAKYDGFLTRDDMPVDFLSNPVHSQYLNKNLDDAPWAIDYDFDKPHFVRNVACQDKRGDDLSHASMSQDEIIGLFIGLGLTSKLLMGTYCGNLAKDLIDKIITYCRNRDVGMFDRWQIRKPDGNYLSADVGGNLEWGAYGFAKAASELTGNPLSRYYNIVGYGDIYEGIQGIDAWQVMQYQALIQVGENGMRTARFCATLAALGDSWLNTTHTTDNTPEIVYGICSINDWEEFYLLLWKVIHGKDFNSVLFSDYSIQIKAYNSLNKAPASGPYCYERPDLTYDMSNYGGWASCLKYNRSTGQQVGISFDDQGHLNNEKGVFTGLDYMLLFNLYRLSLIDNTTDLPIYENLLDKDLYGYLPVHLNVGGANFYYGTGGNTPLSEIDAFNAIESDMIIGKTTQDGLNIPGNVTYRAGDAIDLKPGFTVENGATFTAYVQPFNNGSEFTLKNMDTTASAGLYDFHYDSLEIEFIRPYYTPLAENYPDADETLKDYKIEPPKKDTLTFNNNDIFSMAAYPNPFNNTTTIEYNIPYSSDVNISVFDIYGILVIQAVNTHLEKGQYSNVVNMNNFSKGIYYCKLSSGIQSKTIKLVLSE